ncbi:MAG: pilus assembly protein [Actinobacteria bacterium]|nr:pilus assembly protein [Actinomycetota bacterium]
MLEFALTLPLLLILALGTIDGARLYATWNRTKTGAHEGASYAQWFPLRQAQSGTQCTGSESITARARNEGSDLTVTVSPVASPVCQDLTGASIVQPGQTVAVTAAVPFTFLTPFARALWGDPTIKSTVRVTVQG